MTSSVVRVAIAGSGGRMGQTLIDAVLAKDDLALAGALEIAGSPLIGHDAGERAGRATGITITDDVAAGVRDADVLIDFTRPAATLKHLVACARAGVAAVVGTTGLSASDKDTLGGHRKRGLGQLVQNGQTPALGQPRIGWYPLNDDGEAIARQHGRNLSQAVSAAQAKLLPAGQEIVLIQHHPGGVRICHISLVVQRNRMAQRGRLQPPAPARVE